MEFNRKKKNNVGPVSLHTSVLGKVFIAERLVFQNVLTMASSVCYQDSLFLCMQNSGVETSHRVYQSNGFLSG